MKASNLARTDSLARSSRPLPQTATSLDSFYIGLGKAAKASMLRGEITPAEYGRRLEALMAQYKSLKGGN